MGAHFRAVSFGNAEAAFYHSRDQAVTEQHGPGLSNYASERDEQRRLCAHPAASIELRAAFAKGGGGAAHGRNTTMAQVTDKMVAGRANQLEAKRDQLRRLMAATDRAANSRSVAEAIEASGDEASRRMMEATFASGDAGGGNGVAAASISHKFAWVDDLARLRNVCLEGAGEIMPFNPPDDHELHVDGMATAVRSPAEVSAYIKAHLLTDVGLARYFATQARRTVESNGRKLSALAKEIKELDNHTKYFDSIFDSIKDAGDEGPQCPICLGESVSLAFPDCGHFVCRECMVRWLGQASHGGAGAPCPTCRKDLNSSNIVYFVVCGFWLFLVGGGRGEGRA